MALILEPACERGGEATIHAVRGNQLLAAKIYTQAKADREKKIQCMLNTPPYDPTIPMGHHSIAWPTDALYSSPARAGFVGFLMPRIDTKHFVPAIECCNTRERSRRFGGSFTWKYLLSASCNLVSATVAIHQKGYCIGDLSDTNVLVSDASLITLVDCDSFQVRGAQGRVFRCLVGRPEYTSPELHNSNFSVTDRTVESDSFALAILVFQLLMEGFHPFAGRWLAPGEPPTLQEKMRGGHYAYDSTSRKVAPPPAAPGIHVLPPAIQDMARACFTTGCTRPTDRPLPSRWHSELQRALEDLRVCTRSSTHVFLSHLTDCPWCDRLENSATDTFPTPGTQFNSTRRTSTPGTPQRSFAHPSAPIALTSTPSTPLIVCRSGRGDATCIADAVKNAKHGQRILVRPGTYNEVITINKPITITADNTEGEVIINGTTSCMRITAHDVTLKGLTITANETSRDVTYTLVITAGPIHLEDCRIASANNIALAIIGNQARAQLSRCHISGAKSASILVMDNATLDLTVCEVSGTGNTGIDVRSGSTLRARACSVHDASKIGSAAAQVLRGGMHHLFRGIINAVSKLDGGPIGPPLWLGKQLNGISIGWSSTASLCACTIAANCTGIRVHDNSTATLRQCIITKNASHAIEAQSHSTADAYDCDLRGNVLGSWLVHHDAHTRGSGNKQD